MYTLKNEEATSNWLVDLTEHGQVEALLPMDSINIRNDSSQIAYVNLWGNKVGEIQRFSSDSFSGRGFETFRIYNPDGTDFGVHDLFVQISKGQLMTSQPFNPQWDVLEDDFDRFATGCDSRVSYSSTVFAGLVKYWINVQNNLIVQRKLEVMGGGSVGSYEVEFGGGDVVTGRTAVNFPAVDVKRYRKTISDSAFDYSVTNCAISAWMIDLKKNLNDITQLGTLVSGSVNAYDDKMSTSIFSENDTTGWVTQFELSFPSCSISNAHWATSIKSTSTYNAYVALELDINGVWTVINSTYVQNSTTYIYGHYTGLSHDIVTGVRVRTRSSAGGNKATNYLYDVSLF